MNTPVKFELAKLLKHKEFPLIYKVISECFSRYSDAIDFCKNYPNKLSDTSYVIESYNNTTTGIFYDCCITLNDFYEYPTIAEVVMWLYEKHGIWIEVSADNDCEKFQYVISDECSEYNYNSPTEAYEAAIEYTLKNLI